MQRTKRLHFSSDNTSHSIVQRSARHLSLTSMMDKSLGYHEQWHDKTEDGGAWWCVVWMMTTLLLMLMV